MRKMEIEFPDEETLYTALLDARTKGSKNNGQDRIQFLAPLLNAIAGKNCDWNAEQCAKCFKCMIGQYVELEQRELLLATSGIDENYAGFKNATARRTEYKSRRKEDVEEKALEKRENKALLAMAHTMRSDSINNPAALIEIITNSLGSIELRKLGLENLLAQLEQSSDVPFAKVQKYKRTENISNISFSDTGFIGRDKTLDLIKKGFKEGYHVQCVYDHLGGRGKSHTVLEYARTHKDEYQIICWINNYGIRDSILSFFNDIGIRLEDFSFDHIIDAFVDFLSINSNWLVILDNNSENISTDARIARVEKLISVSKNGHVLITSNDCLRIKEINNIYLSDIDSAENDDEVIVMKKLLGYDASSRNVEAISGLFEGEPITSYILISSYIRQSNWMGFKSYLQMISNFGFEAGKQSRPLYMVAFDLLMDSIHLKQKYLEDQISLALEQALIFFSVLYPSNIDLDFLNITFPVLPDILHSVYSDKGARAMLLSELNKFGIFELRHGVFLYNSLLDYISNDYFRTEDMVAICTEVLAHMEKAVGVLGENRYTPNIEEIRFRVRGYVFQCYSYYAIKTNTDFDDLDVQYPNIALFLKIDEDE